MWSTTCPKYATYQPSDGHFELWGRLVEPTCFRGYQTQFRMFIIMFYIKLKRPHIWVCLDPPSTHKTNVLPHSFGSFAILGALGGCRSSPHFRPTFVCRSRIPLRAENGTPVWCLRHSGIDQESDIHNIDIWFKTISILRYIMIIHMYIYNNSATTKTTTTTTTTTTTAWTSSWM